MQVVHTTSGTDVLDVRIFLPAVNVGSADVAVDLHRDWQIVGVASTEASPLHLLLGTGIDGDEGRLLDLARIGIDWAREAVDQPPLATFETVTGTGAVETMRAALIQRKADLATLGDWAAALGEVEPDTDGWSDLLERLSHLTEIGTVVPLIQGGESGAGMVAGFASNDLVALAAWELMARAQAGDDFERCGHCGCMFAALSRSDEVYCRRTAPSEHSGGRTCAQLGPQRAYKANMSPIDALYRSEYKRLDKRARRGHFERGRLDRWRGEAHQLLERAESRQWSAERFRAQLAAIAPEETR